MKKKIVFSAVLSALILTSCGRETPVIDDLEVTNPPTAQQTVQTAQTGNVPEDGGKTNFALGGDTETTAAPAETSEETTAETEADPEPSLDVRLTDISGIAAEDEQISDGLFVSGDIAAVKCNDNGGGSIKFFDINDLSVKAEIAAPEGWELDNDFLKPCIEGSGDVLCKIKLKRFDEETLADVQAALIVHKDFTTEIAEGEPREIYSFTAGGHNISDQFYDIYDADSGTVLVEGFQDTATELGLDSIWYDYKFQIDSDRFVYRTCGNERTPGFGYYDYNAGAATEFPESKNFFPVGYHDGKVYAEQGTWDSMCQGELYTFDLETLESEHFMSSPVELELNDYTEYYMPPNGEYIIASYQDMDNENYENTKNIVYIISPDSGEVLAQQEFGKDYGDLRFFAFIDDNTFAAYNYNTKEVVVFSVTV